MKAAHRLGVEVTVGSNERQVLESLNEGGSVTIDFSNTTIAVKEICEFHDIYPVIAIIAVDDTTGTRSEERR